MGKKKRKSGNLTPEEIARHEERMRRLWARVAEREAIDEQERLKKER